MTPERPASVPGPADATLHRRDLLLGAAAAAPALLPGQAGAQGGVAAPPTPPAVQVDMELNIPWADYWRSSGDAPAWVGNARFEVAWKGPPPGFNVATATDAELARYGLARSMSDLLQLRFAQLQAPGPKPAFVTIAPPPGPTRPAAVLAGAPVAAPSTNWVGAYVRGIGGRRVSEVAGTWSVADVDAPGLPMAKHEEARLSQWIGLDGADPASRSLPQFGTLRAFKRGEGAAKNQIQEAKDLWWQWWLRDLGTHQEPHRIGFQVAGGGPQRWRGIGQGDTVEARLAVLPPAGPGTARRTFRIWAKVTPNRTTFPDATLDGPVLLIFEVTLVPPMGTIDSRFAVEGRVAEWIVERPRRLEIRKQQDWLYELPRLKAPTGFSACASLHEDGTAAPDLTKASLLRLVNWDDPPALGRRVARVTPAPTATAFTIASEP